MSNLKGCVICGTIFENIRKNKNTCTDKCSKKARAIYQRELQRKKREKERSGNIDKIDSVVYKEHYENILFSPVPKKRKCLKCGRSVDVDPRFHRRICGKCTFTNNSFGVAAYVS